MGEHSQAVSFFEKAVNYTSEADDEDMKHNLATYHINLGMAKLRQVITLKSFVTLMPRALKILSQCRNICSSNAEETAHRMQIFSLQSNRSCIFGAFPALSVECKVSAFSVDFF